MLQLRAISLKLRDEVDTVDEKGWSLLSRAVKNSQLKVINVLLKAGADTSLSTPDGFHPLHIAASQAGNAAIIKALVRAGADIDAGNGALGETALMMAASRGHGCAVRALLDAGADISKRSDNGATARSFAASQGSGTDVLLLLIDAGAGIDDIGSNGNSTLVQAATARHIDKVVKLIEIGANVNLECSDGRTALYHVSQLGFDDILAVLLRSGADVNHKMPKLGMTPLHGACSYGHHKCARLLIEAGAHVWAVDSRAFTPLHYAVTKPVPGHQQVIELLLAAGASLLSAGATINEAPKALISAVYSGCTTAVELLIEAGSNLNSLDSDGRTALFFAKDLDVTKLLLAKGADAKVLDKHKYSVLSVAASREASGGVICALYNAGANPCIKTPNGQTASDIARAKGLKDTAILLDMLADKYRNTHVCEEATVSCARAIEHTCDVAPKTTILKPSYVESSDLDVSDSEEEIEVSRDPAPCLNCDNMTVRLCSGCGDVYYCSETCEMFAKHVCCG